MRPKSACIQLYRVTLLHSDSNVMIYPHSKAKHSMCRIYFRYTCTLRKKRWQPHVTGMVQLQANRTRVAIMRDYNYEGVKSKSEFLKRCQQLIPHRCCVFIFSGTHLRRFYQTVVLDYNVLIQQQSSTNYGSSAGMSIMCCCRDDIICVVCNN